MFMKMSSQSVTSWKSRLRRWADSERIREHEDKILLILTLIIGAIVGLVVVAFILLTENLASRMYPAGGAAWRRLLIPVLGSLIAGWLLQRYFPDARGSGIPQAKAALFIRNGYISFGTTLGKFACSSLSLASGIALGREGPSVHVGAGIASVLGRKLGLSPRRVQALFPVAASAALAAAFNTPIAAVLFALEEVMGDLHARVLGSIVLSSATSWIVLRTLLGDEPLFHVPAYQLVHPGEILIYALLGIMGGLVSVLFVKLLLRLRRYFLALPRWSSWFQPVAGGLLVGLLGWFVPEVLGVGYGQVSRVLNGQLALGVMLLLVILKLVATATCYASGNAGGIFGPSLFIGAMLGGAVGSAAHSLFPDYTGSVGAYALVGMGTAFSGIIRVPLTSVIMIFEVTRDYSVIVPLMISNLLSYFISYRLQREPIYEALQHQEGIHLPSFVRQREGLLLTIHAMRPASRVLRVSETPAMVLPLLTGDEQGAWPIAGQDGLWGMISSAQLEQAIREGRGDRMLGELLPQPHSQEPLTAENFPHVHDDHPLDTVLRRMAGTGLKVLPVVSRSNLRELKGIVSVQDILNAYGLGNQPRRATQAVVQESASPAPLLVGISAGLLSLFVLTGILIYTYRAERRAVAEDAFKKGNGFVRQGLNAEAIEQYRNALAISHSREHRLALAMTLVKAERLNEADIYLRELLREDPNDGTANLGLARIAARQGRGQQAVTYYQRAIYGHWPSRSEENPTKVRFELVDFLRETGAKKQALTELMALEEAVRDSLPDKKRIGRLLLEFNAARESAELFQDVLRQDNRDAEAYVGLGNAEFALGNYRSAREAFRSALRWRPQDQTAQKRLGVCDQIVALDPTLRGLSAAERHRRSEKLLERTLGVFDRCVGSHPDTLTSEVVRNLAERARKTPLRRTKPGSYLEQSETNVLMAAELWKAHKSLCTSPAAVDEVLAALLNRL
jgi:CIC family chloride channel protein